MARKSESVSVETPGLHWPEVRAWLTAHPDRLTDDRALLENLGLSNTGRNVVDLGRAALVRLEAVVEREAGARKEIEETAQANFAAQTQTHAACLDLLEARNHSDLARRLDTAARERFGLAGAAIALEKPGGVPFGWRMLDDGRVDQLIGVDGLFWMGPVFEGLGLFGAANDQVRSAALVRMRLWEPAREALCLFGSADDDGFTASMGGELVAFLAGVTARTAERWPVLT